jgi:hypothetical protein
MKKRVAALLRQRRLSQPRDVISPFTKSRDVALARSRDCDRMGHAGAQMRPVLQVLERL